MKTLNSINMDLPLNKRRKLNTCTDSVTPSSSESSPLTRTCPYDVFLSFRGVDTRNNFTGHLHAFLVQKGIKTFIDDEELRKGEEISSAVVQAIEGSKVSIVIFSENYASSKWCLDELVQIIQYKELKQQLVWPVFYKVDPSEVRNQKGKYGEALAKHESRFKDNMDKVKRWRTALRDAANLSGWTFFDGHEAKFISKIAKDISEQVSRRSYLNVAKYPVGIDSRVQDVLELLDVGGSDVRMVGVWGIGGIGKTTIAKAVYNSIARKFEGSCFLGNVRANSKPHGGLVQLQNNLLDEILGGQETKMIDEDRGIQVIKERLGRKRVLLVLDDVNELNQLDKLAGRLDWFGRGSRIIVTTREKQLLLAHQVYPIIYTAKALDKDEARNLLILNAFKENKSPDKCVQFPIDTAVLFTHGLPLVVSILGSLLCGKSINQWHAALDSYSRFPNSDIHRVLEISYNSLDDPLKEAFLDIACFLQGKDKQYVMQALDSSYLNPMDAIEKLEDKALLNTNFDHIRMHDLLEEMGKEIVRKESPQDAGRRSRLWLYEDVYRVLTENIGSRKVRGIRVELPRDEEICFLSAKCFKKMKNLQLFININARFSREITYLPNQLRFLDWQGFPAQSFPSDFNPRKLVNLNMANSCISRLGLKKNLECLKSLSLESCRFLTEVPDLSGMFPNLEKLNLSSCTGLVELHPSVGFLGKLVEFSLKDCYNLKMFPRIVNMKSLQDLKLSGCKRLEKFPEIEGSMGSLTTLDVSGTAIKQVPPSIGYQVFNLKRLYLENCENLTTLPHSIYKLRWLFILRLAGCTKLMLTPFPNRCKAKAVPSSGRNLALPLLRLRCLEAGRCNISSVFLVTFCCAHTLTVVDFSGSSFVSLPPCLFKCNNLVELYLNGCNRLQEILELPPKVKVLGVSDCVSLETISKLSNILKRQETQMFVWLDLRNCWRLYENLVQEAVNNCSLLVNDDDDGLQVDAYLLSLFLASHKSEFRVALPGIHEFPKCFSSCQTNFHKNFEFGIQVLANFKWENTGLALLCVAAEERLEWTYDIVINGIPVTVTLSEARIDHVPHLSRMWLHYIPFDILDMKSFGSQRPLPPFLFRVTISGMAPLNSCGVHLVMPPHEEECMKLFHVHRTSVT